MNPCGNCRTPVPAEARFCLNCGGQMSDPGAQTVQLGVEGADLLLQVVQRELAKEYDIQRELGRGGMAVVYQAIEVDLGRRVALKVLPPDMAMSRSMAERFKREARMSASLDHPNIIPIFRVGQAGSLFYIAMKLVEGRPLNEIVDVQGALPIPVVMHLMRRLTSALAYAHDRGVVHRDVKCANILIDRDGRALVSDFGIARTVEDPNMTVPGLVIGTPYFMSPEQCASKKLGPQSDQYSLGIALFQLLTGLVPFHADTLTGIMHHHFYTPVPDVSRVRGDVPPALLAVLARALAKKPEDRYATTGAMLAAVEAVPFSAEDRRRAEVMLQNLAIGAPIDRVDAVRLPPLPPTATPSGTPLIGAPVRRRRPALGVIAAAAVVAVAASVATTMLTARGGSPFAAPAEASAATAGTGPEGSPDPASPRLASAAFEGPPATDPVRPAPDPGASGVTSPDERRQSSALPDEGRPTAGAETLVRPTAGAASLVPPSTGGAGAAPPAAATPRPAVPPKSTGEGLLRLRVYPIDAEIVIDGSVLGRGVLVDAPLPAGSHRLRVVAPGFQPHDTVFTVEHGATTQIPSVTLQPARSAP